MNFATCPECGNVFEAPENGIVFHACPGEKYQSLGEIFVSFPVFGKPYAQTALNMMHIDRAYWRPLDTPLPGLTRVSLIVGFKDGKEESYETDWSIAVEAITKIAEFQRKEK